MTALTWRSGLDDAETADVLALLDAAAAVDRTAPVSEHVLLHLRRGGDPQARHLLARNSSGTLVGYAHLDDTDPVAGAVSELAVHPDSRRQGVAAAMVRALLDDVGVDRRLRLWAHGEHPGAVRLAEAMGFRQVRTLWQMRRSLLAPLAEAELPPGVRLRPFVVGRDEAEFLRVNNAAFEWHPEQGGWDVEQVKLREAEPWFDPDGFLLAVESTGDAASDEEIDRTDDSNEGEAERLLGFHWTKVHGATGSGEHQHEPIGEVYVLGVDPAARGRKLGAALTLAGLRYLRDRGLRDVMLYVEADNHAAVNVYLALGFTHWDTDIAYLR